MAEEKAPAVDVEAIMRQIRAEAALQQDLQDPESMPDWGDEMVSPLGYPDRTRYEGSLDYVCTHYEVPYYWPFEGNRIKVFLKRLVRKAVKCMLFPLVEMQNRYNSHVMRCLEQSKLCEEAGRKQAEELAREVETLRQQVAGLQEQVRRLSGTAE